MYNDPIAAHRTNVYKYKTYLPSVEIINSHWESRQYFQKLRPKSWKTCLAYIVLVVDYTHVFWFVFSSEFAPYQLFRYRNHFPPNFVIWECEKQWPTSYTSKISNFSQNLQHLNVKILHPNKRPEKKNFLSVLYWKDEINMPQNRNSGNAFIHAAPTLNEWWINANTEKLSK